MNTDLQRDILITAYNNPRLTQQEIADLCDCSRSYVSDVLSKYDEWDAMNARIEELNRALGLPPSEGLASAPAQNPAWGWPW